MHFTWGDGTSAPQYHSLCDRCFQYRQHCQYRVIQTRHLHNVCIKRGLRFIHAQQRTYISSSFTTAVVPECMYSMFSTLQVYKDDNHKPEMAIAISDFEALCGFVSAQELAIVLAGYPELHPCLGSSMTEAAAGASAPEEQKAHLKSAFTSLMMCDPAKVRFQQCCYLTISLL